VKYYFTTWRDDGTDQAIHDLLRRQVRERARRRGLAVDVLGLVIAVVVLAASVHDNAVGIVRKEALALGPATTRGGVISP
jgi:hypothetical protein